MSSTIIIEGTAVPGAGAAAAARESVVARAIAADEVATEHVSLTQIWQELIAGYSLVVHEFFTPSRCGLVLIANSQQAPSPLVGRRLRILESLLNGDCQKSIAIDLSLAPSTIALNARLALERLGVSCRPSRVHPLLMLAATSARAGAPLVATVARFKHGDAELRVVATPHPSHATVGFPPAERDVVRRLVEGDCYAKISRQRGTSQRTIANQVTAVFRRLRVSGRSELLRWLFSARPHTSVPSAGRGAAHV